MSDGAEKRRRERYEVRDDVSYVNTLDAVHMVCHLCVTPISLIL